MEGIRTKVLIQMARDDANVFNVDFRSPVTFFQAFGACLARFDTKMNDDR